MWATMSGTPCAAIAFTLSWPLTMMSTRREAGESPARRAPISSLPAGVLRYTGDAMCELL